MAFIGYFCIEAGLSLCVAHPLANAADWLEVASSARQLVLSLPGLAAGFVLFLISRKATSDAVLPAAMLAIPGLFYLSLLLTGTSLPEVRLSSQYRTRHPPLALPPSSPQSYPNPPPLCPSLQGAGLRLDERAGRFGHGAGRAESVRLEFSGLESSAAAAPGLMPRAGHCPSAQGLGGGVQRREEREREREDAGVMWCLSRAG